MKFQIGDQIIWCGSLEGTDPIREGTVTKVSSTQGNELLFVDRQHKPEDCIYAAYCWPAHVKAKLQEILDERRRLKKAFDDSMGLVYELRNAVTRREV